DRGRGRQAPDGSARPLVLVRLGRARRLDRGPEAPVLLLERAQPLLDRGGGARREGLCLLSLRRRLLVVLVQLGRLLLEQAEGLAQRPGGLRQLLGAEEQHQDEEDQEQFRHTDLWHDDSLTTGEVPHHRSYALTAVVFTRAPPGPDGRRRPGRPTRPPAGVSPGEAPGRDPARPPPPAG